MSKIDTMNSKSNLDCIADELFTELTPEASEVIQGGAWNIELYEGKNLTNYIGGVYNFYGGDSLKTVSSIRLNAGTWRLYTDIEGEGTYGTVSVPGDGNLTIEFDNNIVYIDNIDLAGGEIESTNKNQFSRVQ